MITFGLVQFGQFGYHPNRDFWFEKASKIKPAQPYVHP